MPSPPFGFPGTMEPQALFPPCFSSCTETPIANSWLLLLPPCAALCQTSLKPPVSAARIAQPSKRGTRFISTRRRKAKTLVHSRAKAFVPQVEVPSQEIPVQPLGKRVTKDSAVLVTLRATLSSQRPFSRHLATQEAPP